MKNIFDIVSSEYPGRGIAIGAASDGRRCAVYFIMGRSENSRNRVFVREGSDVFTRAYDESKLKDPSLVIYRAATVLDGRFIVTNGDQTDTIASALYTGGGFIPALMTREFEPDMPNCTPRISALYEENMLSISILKCENERGEGCVREFFTYPVLKAGEGYFISTYSGLREQGALMPFVGEPKRVSFSETGEALARGVWESLNRDNKVALYARFWREGEQVEHIIINKLGEKLC